MSVIILQRSQDSYILSYKYLYSMKDKVLCLGGKNLCLHAYSNTDFAGDSDDRHSTSGYTIFLGARAISWSSRQQSVVVLSSIESEYIALSEVTQEIMWTCHFFEEIDITYEAPTTIFKDNKGTIAFMSNQKTLHCMKHIEVKYHFVKKLIEDSTICLQYRPTSQMVTDILTKPLSPMAHVYHANRLGVMPPKLEEEC